MTGKVKKNNDKNTSKNGFSFVRAKEQVISNLPARSRDIVKERFGVKDGRPKTLESIGRSYQITRERVRQIVKEAIRKAKNNKSADSFLKAEKKIRFTIEKNSGIIKTESLLGKLGKDSMEKGAVNFFLHCVDSVVSAEQRREMEKAVALSGFDFDDWKKTEKNREKQN